MIFQSFKKLFIPKEEKVKLDIMDIYYGHHRVTYKGIEATRCPMDYVMYQMIIGEVKPDLIIEVGCNKGGGSIYLSDLMRLYDLRGEVHAIDITDSARQNLMPYPDIKFFNCGWENYDLVASRSFSNILIIEDAAHTYESSLGIMNKFSPLVSKNSYLIVEDGIVDELGFSKKLNGGPLKAIREFLPKHKEFIVDRRWCDMFGKNTTFNVNGYLKRVQ